MWQLEQGRLCGCTRRMACIRVSTMVRMHTWFVCEGGSKIWCTVVGTLLSQRPGKRAYSGPAIPCDVHLIPHHLVPCSCGDAGPHLLPWHRALQPGSIHGVQRHSHGENIRARTNLRPCSGSISVWIVVGVRACCFFIILTSHQYINR